MSLPMKVLWSEGLTLGPHQFQQLDRYHEARLQHTAAALQPKLWGIQSVPDILSDSLAPAREMSRILGLGFRHMK